MFLESLEVHTPKTINTISEIIVGTDDGDDETNDDETNIRHFVVLDNDIYISYLLLNTESDNSLVTNISFLFDEIMQDAVYELIGHLEVYAPSDYDNTLDDEDGSDEGNDVVIAYTMTLDDGLIKLDPFVDVSHGFKDIGFYYNNEVMDDTLDGIAQLNTLNKGIVAIIGERGVGKTNLLKYIVSNIDLGRKIVYVPIQLFEVFNANDINRFITLNPNTIFILDDFELHDYVNEKIISSIVHLVDGFKSDIYNSSFIICCNEKYNKNSMFACNNLHRVIEVGSLTTTKAKSLRKLLKLKNIDNDLRLISVLKEQNNILTKKPGY
jgi:hypothetical protein